jgi:hypothetical protein
MHIFTGDFNFFIGLTARRLYKSFGVKGLSDLETLTCPGGGAHMSLPFPVCHTKEIKWDKMGSKCSYTEDAIM